MNLAKIADIFGRGFIPELAPSIIRGLLIENLQKVDMKELYRWIETDVSLWSKIDPKYHDDIKKVAPKLGNINWFTLEWLQEGLRKKLPKLCSLFMGDEDARRWLESQIEDIKNHILKPVP